MRTDARIDSSVHPMRRLSMDETGATALEYGFFVAFAAAALLLGAEVLAGGVDSMYSIVRGVVSSKVGGS